MRLIDADTLREKFPALHPRSSRLTVRDVIDAEPTVESVTWASEPDGRTCPVCHSVTRTAYDGTTDELRTLPVDHIECVREVSARCDALRVAIRRELDGRLQGSCSDVRDCDECSVRRGCQLWAALDLA